MDNIIEWMFEKIFDSFYKKDDFCKVPYNVIKNKTFENEFVYSLINKSTGRNINGIRNYLNDINYQRRFVQTILKDYSYVQIVFDDVSEISHVTNDHLFIALVNSKIDWFQSLSKGKILIPDMLMYVAEWSLEDTYFYLREQGLVPNLNVLKKACLGTSVKILSDCLDIVAPTKEMIELAFQNNKTDIIIKLVQDQNFSPTLFNNFIAYALTNSNYELIKFLEENGCVTWHIDLYYSALLSGSFDIVKYVESKIYVHEKRVLDTSNSKQGERSLLLDEIVYTINGTPYFSHTMNYAIQSGSLEIVKYVRSLNYGITVSNVISAINSGNVEILKYILSECDFELPFYLIHYVGITNYCPNKLQIAKVLKDHTNVFDKKPSCVNDYRLERVHLDIIHSKEQTDCDDDIDFFMKHTIFFEYDTKMNYHTLNYAIIMTRLGYDIDIKNTQMLIDVVYLFGTLDQVKRVKGIPNIRIVAELFCRNAIAKLLTFKIPVEYRSDIKNVVDGLNDDNLIKLFNIIKN